MDLLDMVAAASMLDKGSTERTWAPLLLCGKLLELSIVFEARARAVMFGSGALLAGNGATIRARAQTVLDLSWGNEIGAAEAVQAKLSWGVEFGFELGVLLVIIRKEQVFGCRDAALWDGLLAAFDGLKALGGTATSQIDQPLHCTLGVPDMSFTMVCLAVTSRQPLLIEFDVAEAGEALQDSARWVLAGSRSISRGRSRSQRRIRGRHLERL